MEWRASRITDVTYLNLTHDQLAQMPFIKDTGATIDMLYNADKKTGIQVATTPNERLHSSEKRWNVEQDEGTMEVEAFQYHLAKSAKEVAGRHNGLPNHPHAASKDGLKSSRNFTRSTSLGNRPSMTGNSTRA